MGLSNAERQERWRIKRAKEVEALRKAAAKAAPTSSRELDEARKEIKRLTAELETETAKLYGEIHRLEKRLVLAAGARQEQATVKGRRSPAQGQTPAQLQRDYQQRFQKPKGMENYHVTAKWLRGHKDRVIEVTIASSFTSDPLDRAEQMLAAMPGVYRIARIVGGSFGSEGDDMRPQARALMAVTERALQAEADPGGWCGGVVVYDPRVT